MNSLDLGYSTSTTKVYWCHLCKKEFNKIFIENVEVQCRFCGNNFCEETSSERGVDHPSNFQPYESSSSNAGNQSAPGMTNGTRASSLLNMIYMPRPGRPRTTSSFLDMIINVLGGLNEENNMENIINYILANDPNRYGNPPASKKSIDSLEKIIINDSNLKLLFNDCDNSCPVCKDCFEIDQKALTLPCKHIFHDDCILPWFKERNSCPTCRYELATDDPDYEARKK
jgi:E3 ubiquitin-protein ligase RNF115/126